MNHLAPIINRPAAPPWPARIGWHMLAALLWTLWIGCWIPLVTLGIWQFGVVQLRDVLAATDSWAGLWRLAAPCIAIVVALGTLLLGWAMKETLLFQPLQRRRQSAPVNHAELAAHAGLSPAALAYWQGARRILCQHDDQGVFLHARIEHHHGTRLVRSDTRAAGSTPRRAPSNDACATPQAAAPTIAP